MGDQTAKQDEGKLRLSLVPSQIIRDVAEVREYGNKKYHSPDNWKQVEIQRYRDAAYRHLLAYIDDPAGKDEESGIEHYKHLACNLAFICEMERSSLSHTNTDFQCESAKQSRENSVEIKRSSQDLEIIHCRDCRHSEHWYGDKYRCFLWYEDGISVLEDGFCNYARRRTND